jgi:outer membrane cobalamin receptor
MLRTTILFGLYLFSSLTLLAQVFTISGYISDSSSGEGLWGATVYDMKSKQGVSTNNYGFYSLSLPVDTVKLRISFVGYQTQFMEIYLNKNFKENIELVGSLELDEIAVYGDEKQSAFEDSRMSTINISMDAIKSLPVFLGETDVLKTIQLMPGVQSGGEGTSGLYVRGGGPDQNLILLDGVPVYNASHLFGFFSVFNANSIKSVKLIKGGFPANYGGRLSSVIDIRMKEGNNKKFHGEAGIGIISAHLTLEGPIIKNKTSFIVSARRTYIDILAQPFIRASIKDAQGTTGSTGYFFYDLNAKINHKFSDKHRLYLSGYLGNDKFYSNFESNYRDGDTRYYSEEEGNLKWGNIISALRWNYLIGPKLFSNTTITYSKYKFDIGFIIRDEDYVDEQLVSFDEFQGNYFSGIEDLGVKFDFNWMASPANQIIFGGGYTNHTFSPGVQNFKSSFSGGGTEVDTTLGSSDIYANEIWLYFEDEIKFGARLVMNIGFHTSGFGVENSFYFSFQPRVSLSYLVSEKTAIKASYAEMNQYLHLLSNTSIGLPTDLWLPPTDRVKPQFSRQVAVGVAHSFNKKYQVSVEGYYKVMENLIAYKDGASFFTIGADWQDLIETGKGWSYGVEIMFEKNLGKTTGWIGYTLSWSNRQFEDISFGEIFPYRYDRRHDISVAITHRFNERVDIGVVWVYGTGNAVTLGLERYLSIEGARETFQYGSGYNDIEYIAQRNNYRMASYHRLDVGVNLHKKKKWGERTWSLGFYNIYNRQNPFYLYFGNDIEGNKQLYQASLFPILPAISYNLKF